MNQVATIYSQDSSPLSPRERGVRDCDRKETEERREEREEGREEEREEMMFGIGKLKSYINGPRISPLTMFYKTLK